MSNANASGGYGAISKETTPGVAVTTPDFFYPFQEIDFDYPNELIEFSEIRGSRQANQVQDGPIRPTATVRGAIYPSGGFALMLLGLLGKVSTDEIGASGYKHTFEDAPTLPTFTLERSNAYAGEGTPFCQRLAGCKVETLGITLAFGEQVEFNASFQAMKKPVDGVAVSRSAVTFPNELPLYFGGASVKVDGVANSHFQTLNIEFTNTLSRQEALNGSQESFDIYEGGFATTLSGTMSFANRDMYQKLINGDEIEIEIHCDNKQILDAGSNTNWGLDLEFPRVRVARYSTPFTAGEIITADVEFSVLYDPIEKKSVTPILSNNEDGEGY